LLINWVCFIKFCQSLECDDSLSWVSILVFSSGNFLLLLLDGLYSPNLFFLKKYFKVDGFMPKGHTLFVINDQFDQILKKTIIA
jgi:hypothetical protein